MTMRACVTCVACLAVIPMLVETSQRGQPPSLAWQMVLGGPMGGTASQLMESQSGVLLARVDDVLYRSTDDGRSWRRCRELPSRPAPQSPYEKPSWLWSKIADNERIEPRREYRPNTLDVTDGRCETFGTVQIPGWTGNKYDPLSFAFASNSVVAVIGGRALRSNDRGATWRETFTFRGGPTCARPRFRDLLVVAGSALYESKDDGATWSVVPEDPDAARTGVAAPGRSPKLGCPFIQANNHTYLYAVGPEGLWRSYPLDTPEWVRVHNTRPELIAATERRVWMQMQTPQGKVLMRSEDEGATWTTTPFALADGSQIYELLDTERGTLLAATNAGIFRSTDKGNSWTLTGVAPEKLTVAASRQLTYVSDRSGLWITRDGGASWQKVQAVVDGRPWRSTDQLSRVFDVPGRIAAVINDELFRVSADGASFVRAGLDHYVESIVHVKGTYYAATSDGVFRSGDFATWEECSLGLNGEFTAGPLLVIGRGDLLRGGIARSTDGCRSWWPFDVNGSRRTRGFMFSRSREIVEMGEGIGRLNLDTGVWAEISDDTELDVASAAVDSRGRYWMGTTNGVYTLDPDAYGWNALPVGLQHERIEQLVVDRRGYLIVAVRHRGLYRAALP